MYPPIFATCAADAGVVAALGSNPTRLYPFDEAPSGVVKPYAVWSTISGFPENTLSEVPKIDQWSIQVDVYGETAQQARDSAQALRDAIEPHAHIVSWGGEGRDPATKLYRYSFDVDWFVNR